MESVECCDEFEEFIGSTSLNDWWGQIAGFIDGATMRELTSCVMLMDNNVPKRMRLIKERKWWTDIDRMLSTLGVVSCEADYCVEIHNKLSYYEHYREVATLLELAVWKTKVMIECEGNSDPTIRSQARGNCGYSPIYNESLYQDDILCRHQACCHHDVTLSVDGPIILSSLKQSVLAGGSRREKKPMTSNMAGNLI